MIQLGIIPDFQFRTPPYNPEGFNYTSRLKFPAGMDQLTVQPVGGYPTNNGLGITMAAYLPPRVGALSGVFDSVWWQQRKWLAVGIVAVLGVGTAALAAKVLK